jgi:hypothetical protein
MIGRTLLALALVAVFVLLIGRAIDQEFRACYEDGSCYVEREER